MWTVAVWVPYFDDGESAFQYEEDVTHFHPAVQTIMFVCSMAEFDEGEDEDESGSNNFVRSAKWY